MCIGDTNAQSVVQPTKNPILADDGTTNILIVATTTTMVTNLIHDSIHVYVCVCVSVYVTNNKTNIYVMLYNNVQNDFILFFSSHELQCEW